MRKNGLSTGSVKITRKQQKMPGKNGVSISNTKGRLRRHLDKYYLNNEEKNGHITKFKLYNNHIFLFSKNVLVTVITLPGRLLQLVHQTIKKEHTR